MSATRAGRSLTAGFDSTGITVKSGSVRTLAAILSGEEPLIGDGLRWQDRALCAETDPEQFFPEKGGSTRQAKNVCRLCTARPDCLEYALGNDEQFGIWGGLSEQERRAIRRAAENPEKAAA